MGHWVMQLAQVQLLQVNLPQLTLVIRHLTVGKACASDVSPGVATRTSRSNWFAALIS